MLTRPGAKNQVWPRGGKWAGFIMLLLGSCAPPGPGPLAIAQDRSGQISRAANEASAPAKFAGYYAGIWTPSPGGTCAGAAPQPRDMMVEPPYAASGANYPFRGLVQPDGTASLSYGHAVLAGQFGPDGFAGRADTGDGCGWQVALARQAPIGLLPGSVRPPGADVIQGEIPDAPAREADPLSGASLGR